MPKAPGEGIREIVESRQAPGVMLREAHNHNAAWDHRGLWGALRSSESAVVAETRNRLELGNYKSARHRINALTYMRGYELAAMGDMKRDGIVDNLRRLNAANDETIERFGPGGKLIKRRLGERKIRTRDGSKGIERRTRIEVA